MRTLGASPKPATCKIRPTGNRQITKQQERINIQNEQVTDECLPK